MYSIRVAEGRERVEVRKYSSAFVPSYIPAPQPDASEPVPGGTRKLIVPGYVFTLRAERQAVPVPEDECRIIDALSSSRPSVIDDTGKIVSGPLAGLEDAVAGVETDRVLIRVRLLGKTREYWIRVRHEAEDAVPSSGPVSSAGNTLGQEEAAMAYTREQIDTILADAEIKGIHAAARSAGVPWQTVCSWAKKSGRQITPKAEAADKKRTGSAAGVKKTEQSPPETVPESDLSPLEIENAVLRERIRKLENKIQKLKKAIAELM